MLDPCGAGFATDCHQLANTRYGALKKFLAVGGKGRRKSRRGSGSRNRLEWHGLKIGRSYWPNNIAWIMDLQGQISELPSVI